MDKPDYVLRKNLDSDTSSIAIENLFNLSRWANWNSSAKRILSETKDNIDVGTRFDLHRIENGRLVEEFWQVDSVKKNTEPNYALLKLKWLGQNTNGKPTAGAILSLEIEIIIVCEKEGGIEISAWWNLTRLSRVLRIGNKIARNLVSGLFDDLCQNATIQIKDSVDIDTLD